jgi:hypothetical protein
VINIYSCIHKYLIGSSSIPDFVIDSEDTRVTHQSQCFSLGLTCEGDSQQTSKAIHRMSSDHTSTMKTRKKNKRGTVITLDREVRKGLFEEVTIFNDDD